MAYFSHILARRSRLLAGCIGMLLATTIASQWTAAKAVQFADGSTMFAHPPRLVSFVTTENTTSRKNATYYVTVNLLPEADEPLETLKVALIEGRFTRLDFHTDDIRVFAGDRTDRQADYAVEAAEYDDDTQTLTIQLAKPAAPGQLLTFALKPVRNPTSEGVYLFEVTAAPAGEKPVFQRIGTGRLHMYRDPFFSLL